jgi:hypothetical protein
MKFAVSTLLVILCWSSSAHSQKKEERYTIAVFAPLYLDSAYDANGEYKFEKATFPKYITPGLDFYQGVKLALDTLNKENAPLDIFVYDTRSSKESLNSLLNRPEINNASLLLTYCTANEVRTFAEAGLQKNIPVINVNLPNDGGITSNPFFVLMNATLKTQCNGIINYTRSNFNKSNIVVFRKKGSLEDKIKSYFDESNNSSKPLKLSYVDLPDSFNAETLKKYVDTTKQNVFIAGSLDEQFGRKLVSQISLLPKSGKRFSILGMPTWESIRDFSKSEYRDLDIYYSTSFFSTGGDKVSEQITSYYNASFYVKPSDMVLRGYEATWKFAKLLLKSGKDLPSNLSSRLFSVFRDTDVQPVINSQKGSLDYFENKKLYFLKWQDGIIIPAK